MNKYPYISIQRGRQKHELLLSYSGKLSSVRFPMVVSTRDIRLGVSIDNCFRAPVAQWSHWRAWTWLWFAIASKKAACINGELILNEMEPLLTTLNDVGIARDVAIWLSKHKVELIWINSLDDPPFLQGQLREHPMTNLIVVQFDEAIQKLIGKRDIQ